MRFCEPVSHEAWVQLEEIEKTFEEISSFSGKKMSVLDLAAVIFDTTSSNTGMSHKSQNTVIYNAQ